jgi:hypothetical protein
MREMAARTNCFGLGIRADVLRILLMAEVTRYDWTSWT